ncbi:cysteine-rich CWC family protein [Chitinophaga nivalis]|uniref:Cysteine-rich CWC family protein n=1 Tax=Chitinophaga nivalis TaxID=2991709 RepID=A0ABT3IGH4_9BACT|nr:cysteine-rich CWC family protein [Chitinophaga nivalis]MCW3467388.1 cysteine-rich CWC family protein [Chitinophaga nivalis]MCW3482920.1 cysteine-rich CWC family protein [Chitinophaga nivalis]
MADHETVTCPRCQCSFECRVGTILRCQCMAVTLTEEERYFIRQQYTTCLCAACLLDLQTTYRQSPDDRTQAS